MTSQVGMSLSQISVPVQSSEDPTKNASQDLRLRACRIKEPKLFALFPKGQCLSSDITRPSSARSLPFYIGNVPVRRCIYCMLIYYRNTDHDKEKFNLKE